ncbi:unnamed protein product [Ectocarpus sp. 13 AM-2016]
MTAVVVVVVVIVDLPLLLQDGDHAVAVLPHVTRACVLAATDARATQRQRPITRRPPLLLALIGVFIWLGREFARNAAPKGVVSVRRRLEVDDTCLSFAEYLCGGRTDQASPPRCTRDQQKVSRPRR